MISAPDGLVDVTLGGSVTGHGGDAVRVAGGSGGVVLDLAAGVSLTGGAQDGLDVAVSNGGGVTLTGAGNLAGTTGVGLRVLQSGGSGDLTLATGAVSGGAQGGILLSQHGSGEVSLVATGLVRGGQRRGDFGQHPGQWRPGCDTGGRGGELRLRCGGGCADGLRHRYSAIGHRRGQCPAGGAPMARIWSIMVVLLKSLRQARSLAAPAVG